MRLHPRIFAALAIPLLAGTSEAAESPLLYSIIAPTAARVPGSTVEVQVAVLNGAAGGPVTVDLPATLAARISGSGRRQTVSLQARDATGPSSHVVAPGGFSVRSYTLTLPGAEWIGHAILEVELPGGAPMKTALEIATTAQTGGSPTEHPTTSLARAQSAAAALRHIFAERLGTHEPIYFIYGLDAPAAKFQFSFKYRLLDFTGLTPQRRARSLQFAFTQRSLWDIEADSSPFFDTSYMPEIMYESLAPTPEDSKRWFTWLGFQAAAKHESNGRDGPDSRSLDIVYARPVFAFGPLDGWHLLAMPELFTYLNPEDEISRLEDYRGYGKLNLVFGRNDGPSLMASVWAGKDYNHVSTQFDLTFPVRTRLLNFGTYILIQYFNGYGESLRGYTEQSETIRAGVSLVR
jgi:outer membrane phospholipase A